MPGNKSIEQITAHDDHVHYRLITAITYHFTRSNDDRHPQIVYG